MAARKLRVENGKLNLPDVDNLGREFTPDDFLRYDGALRFTHNFSFRLRSCRAGSYFRV